MNDLLNNAEVEHVEKIPTNKNPQLSGFTPSDYFWGTNTSNPQGDLWHLKRTMAGKAWDITKGNPNIKIATIDGGFDISHPDLSGKFIYNYDPEDLSTFTNCSIVEHGTLQASFIAATTDGGGYLSGLGFNCKLISFNATNNLGGSIGSTQITSKKHYKK